MVHWLGEGTDVIICLAREPPLGPLDDPKKLPPPSPSSVFLSYDYGEKFEDKSGLFNLTINGSIVQSTVDEFITHLKFNTVSLKSKFGTHFLLSPRKTMITDSVFSRVHCVFTRFGVSSKQF